MMKNFLLDDFLIANSMFVKEIYFRSLKKDFGQGFIWKKYIGQSFSFQRKIKILGSLLKWGLTVSQAAK